MTTTTQTTPPAPPAPPRWVAWVRIAARVWQKVGEADSQATALMLAADHMRQRHLSGDCYALPVDSPPGRAAARPATPPPTPGEGCGPTGCSACGD